MFKTFCSIARLKNDTFVRIFKTTFEKRSWNFFKMIFNRFICEFLTLLTSSKNSNKESISQWVNWSWFSFYLKKIFRKFSRQKHFNLFYAMHDFLKRILLKVDCQRIIRAWFENQALLLERIELISNFVKKTKNNARNKKKREVVLLSISKKKNENSSNNVDAFNDV